MDNYKSLNKKNFLNYLESTNPEWAKRLKGAGDSNDIQGSLSTSTRTLTIQNYTILSGRFTVFGDSVWTVQNPSNDNILYWTVQNLIYATVNSVYAAANTSPASGDVTNAPNKYFSGIYGSTSVTMQLSGLSLIIQNNTTGTIAVRVVQFGFNTV